MDAKRQLNMTQFYRSPHLHSLFSAGKVAYYTKGQMVGSTEEKGQSMLVVKGYIKRYMISGDGSLGIQIVYGPQDLFSLTQIYRELLGQSLYDGPEVYYYQALCDVQLMYLHTETLVSAVADDMNLYKELFSEAGHHLKSCVHSLENMSFGNVYNRVSHQLVFFAREYGTMTPEGLQIDIPLIHQDIADILQTTRESVTRAMVGLRDKGILQPGRHIIITDLDRLIAEAYV